MDGNIDDLYDREGVDFRVVELTPDDSWTTGPTVYEGEA